MQEWGLKNLPTYNLLKQLEFSAIYMISLVLCLDRYLLQFLVFKKRIYLGDHFYLYIDYDSRKNEKEVPVNGSMPSISLQPQTRTKLKNKIFIKLFLNDKSYSNF